MYVFNSRFGKFSAQGVSAETLFVTPRGFPHIRDKADVFSLQKGDVAAEVRPLVPERVDIQCGPQGRQSMGSLPKSIRFRHSRQFL